MAPEITHITPMQAYQPTSATPSISLTGLPFTTQDDSLDETGNGHIHMLQRSTTQINDSNRDTAPFFQIFRHPIMAFQIQETGTSLFSLPASMQPLYLALSPQGTGFLLVRRTGAEGDNSVGVKLLRINQFKLQTTQIPMPELALSPPTLTKGEGTLVFVHPTQAQAYLVYPVSNYDVNLSGPKNLAIANAGVNASLRLQINPQGEGLAVWTDGQTLSTQQLRGFQTVGSPQLLQVETNQAIVAPQIKTDAQGNGLIVWQQREPMPNSATRYQFHLWWRPLKGF